MNNLNTISRRQFIKGSGATAVSLLVGFKPDGALALSPAGSASRGTQLNPFVRIDSDGVVTVMIKHFEMGQGTTTGLATIVAEELGAAWDQVRTEYAPANEELYKNLFFGMQGTGGSTAIANSFMQHRQAGAAARAVLVQAAAKQWGVEPAAITLMEGVLSAGEHSASIGEFVESASRLEVPAEPTLKSPAEFTLIGNESLHRKDNDDKTDGRGVFAMDVQVPDMLYVVMLRPTHFGGVLKDFDASGAQDISGFVDAKALPDHSAVAIYAHSTWAAIKARRAVTANWDNSNAEMRSSEQMQADLIASLDADPEVALGEAGQVQAAEAVAASASKTLKFDFLFPALAHAPMEPLNCVIEKVEGGLVVHDGCQFPGAVRHTVAAITGVPIEHVSINTVYAGGSFGRRANPTSDYTAEAAKAYVALGGKHSIKLVWTREDDTAGGYYRPVAAHRVSVGLDDNGAIVAWGHRITAQSIMKGTPFEAMLVKDGVENTLVEGVADSPYSIPGMSVAISYFESPMRALWWRSVGHTHTAFVIESVMDAIASETGQDPVELRLSLLDETDPVQGRFAGVLKRAAAEAKWPGTPAPGKARGVAVHHSFASFVAEVVDISVTNDQVVHVDKVTCVVDCGIAVNPDVIRAQMEGGIGFGLGAVMRNAITLDQGKVVEQNFPQYRPIRISDMPSVEVHIMASTEAPTGVGEPAVPPAGPALANAIFSATGQRVTTLPMTASGIRFG